MLEKIDHIGIAVKSLSGALSIYTDGFEMKAGKVEVVKSMSVKLCFVNVGGTKIELLEGIDNNSPISKFINRKGEGVHHICYVVDDIKTVLQKLKSRGYKLIDKVPKEGAGGSMIAFVHPVAASGVLIELKEKNV